MAFSFLRRRGGRLGLCAAAALLLPAAADQTDDLALVAQFVAKARGSDLAGASALLAAGARIGDSRSSAERTLEQFADYAAACPLEKISTVVLHSGSDRRPFPVGAAWSCKYPQPGRQASFWVENGRIVRLAFGPPMVVRTPPIRRP
jgi:hypothetical protein